MRLGCFATEVGEQLRGLAEIIFLLLTVKTFSAETPESFCEITLVPSQDSLGTPAYPLFMARRPVSAQAWAPRLCLICLFQDLSTTIPELLIRFPVLILCMTPSLSFVWSVGGTHCDGHPYRALPARVLWVCALLVWTR